jgi:hypothetical protein
MRNRGMIRNRMNRYVLGESQYISHVTIHKRYAIQPTNDKKNYLYTAIDFFLFVSSNSLDDKKLNARFEFVHDERSKKKR